jgi:spermidine synthase
VIAVHFLLESLGLRWALAVGAAIDVGLGVALLALTRRGTGRPLIGREALAGIAALAVIAIAFDVDPRRSSSGVFRTGAARLGPGNEIVFHRDGKTATVDVVDNKGMVSIRTNGKPDASLASGPGQLPTGDEYTMALLGVLPLGHRPEAKTAAVIGFGSGMTTAILLGSPNLQRVDSIEIEPAMVEGARHFRPAVDAAFADPRSHIVIDDAKSYFARGGARYDIIVSEPSNPWVSGVASLFTQEFYARLSRHLNDGGVLSQWLHTYEMDTVTLASIIEAVSRTFPQYAIYSSIDSDIVLIARKGGAPGRFDGKVLAYEGLKPVLGKLKLSEPDVVGRRLIAGSDTVSPFLRTYGAPLNSDFFPIVDQRASKTRFTRARANELIELQASPIPMLEMLGSGAVPSRERHDAIRAVFIEQAVDEAWAMRDVVAGSVPARPPAPEANVRDLAARLVRSWVTSCRKDEDFDRMLPSLLTVAEGVNARLHPDVAAQLWRTVGDAPCAKSLAAPQRRWIDLFDAVGRRDAPRMAAVGSQILEADKASRTSATEYAFFATVTALACEGEKARARDLINRTAQGWVRDKTRDTEMRFLVAMTDNVLAPAGRRGACALPGR